MRAAAPDDLSPLADYDDWPATLLTHEHTHIVHFEQAGLLPALVRRVFGRLYSPQGYLPGWFIEGLATRQESLHTSGGRARSTTFEMYLRMHALGGSVLGLDWIGFDGEPWPHGNVRYLYGQAFVGFIAARHGDAALGRFVREYGRRIVPYGLNRALRRATGETFTALYAAFTAQLRARAREVQREVDAQGRVEGEALTTHGELTRSPRYVSDHEVVYALADARHVPALRTLSLRTGKSMRITRVSSVGQVAVVPGTLYELATEASGGGTRIVLSTSGADAVGFHAWSLRARSLLDARDLGLEVGYTYRKPRFPLLTYASYRDRDRGDLTALGRRRSWHAREGSFGVATSFWLPAPLYAFRLRVDYVVGFVQSAGGVLRLPLDPNHPPPRRPHEGFGTDLTWSASYDSTQRQAFDVSRSWGQLVTLAGSVKEPAIGGRTRRYGVSYRAEQFVRLGARESVIAVAYTGAHATSVTLGGFPALLAPLGDALLGTRGAPVDYARLRGLPTRRGDTLQVVQLEYRVLVSRLNRGVDTLPLFARRVHAALFADAGDAWTRGRESPQLGVGVGAELRLDWSAHYGNDYTLRGGVAHGVTRGGELQWYTTLAAPF